ncbi:MAG: DNA cytosine methyltransferase [Eubacterium sp.]|nr:DNA cytosine methyltransferase [Eubacterium sp.]
MTNELTAVSLFTGAGGMDIGFERAGIKVVFANELMSEAAATYNANHEEGIMVNDDINNVLVNCNNKLDISI